MMKKFSWSYVRSHPIMFSLIFLVFGLILWLVLNRGSGASGGDVVYQSAGSDPAKLAAEVALGQASIAANAQLQSGQMQIAALQIQGQNDFALGNLSAQIALATLGSDERLGERSITAQLEMMKIEAATSRAMQADALGFQLGYQQSQNDLTLKLSAQQADAYKLSSILSVIPSLKKKNRDESLQLVTLASYGQQYSLVNGPVNTVGTTVTGSGGNPAYALPPPSIN